MCAAAASFHTIGLPKPDFQVPFPPGSKTNKMTAQATNQYVANAVSTYNGQLFDWIAKTNPRLKKEQIVTLYLAESKQLLKTNPLYFKGTKFQAQKLGLEIQLQLCNEAAAEMKAEKAQARAAGHRSTCGGAQDEATQGAAAGAGAQAAGAQGANARKCSSAVCQSAEKADLVCSRCKIAWYCNAKCQAADLKAHKRKCAEFRKLV